MLNSIFNPSSSARPHHFPILGQRTSSLSFVYLPLPTDPISPNSPLRYEAQRKVVIYEAIWEDWIFDLRLRASSS